MADDKTQKRIKELEAIEREYLELKHLIDLAAKDQLPEHANKQIIIVDSTTSRVIHANSPALALLGYSGESLVDVLITELEVPTLSDSQQSALYVENSREEFIYTCAYRHHDGHLFPVRVYKRMLEKEGRRIWHYSLEALTLHQRLWYELSRREDADFKFQQKLKILNEINFDLNNIDDPDALCRMGVKLGTERLGFDRISLWFLDRESNRMVGSYGVGEDGEIRDERNERWTFDGTHVIDFLAGYTNPIVVHDEAPLYNGRSEILGSGWHISVPMLNGEEFIGFMAADNLISQRPMISYEPELLRLYGITIGHLTALVYARHQKLKLHVEQERLRMLKTFITDVGHDFRTPLSIINANAYLIQKIKDEEKQKALTNTIQEQVSYITKMINDMLDIVRLEYEPQINVENINLKNLLMSVVRTYDAAASAKAIVWGLQLEDAPSVMGDHHYLQQAVGCLVENALQYTPEGGQITLQICPYDTMIGIRIQDQGIGIEAEHLEKIFKPLYRINEARTDRGSGLGLSIAKIIAEAHQGHITVKSVVGEGSVFEILLPWHDEAELFR